MRNRLILCGLMVVLLFTMFSGIVAANTNSTDSSGTPNSTWDVRGTYTWLLTGTQSQGTWSHDLVIIDQNPDGTFSGTGGLPAGHSPYVSNSETYETITGKVVGNQITITTTYDGPYNKGYTATFSGTIAPDGTMSGNSPWNWRTTYGAASKPNSGEYQMRNYVPIETEQNPSPWKLIADVPLPPWIAILAVIGGIILIQRRDR